MAAAFALSYVDLRLRELTMIIHLKTHLGGNSTDFRSHRQILIPIFTQSHTLKATQAKAYQFQTGATVTHCSNVVTRIIWIPAMSDSTAFSNSSLADSSPIVYKRSLLSPNHIYLELVLRLQSGNKQ